MLLNSGGSCAARRLRMAAGVSKPVSVSCSTATCSFSRAAWRPARRWAGEACICSSVCFFLAGSCGARRCSRRRRGGSSCSAEPVQGVNGEVFGGSSGRCGTRCVVDRGWAGRCEGETGRRASRGAAGRAIFTSRRWNCRRVAWGSSSVRGARRGFGGGGFRFFLCCASLYLPATASMAKMMKISTPIRSSITSVH